MAETTTMTTSAEEEKEAEKAEEALKLQTESLSSSRDRAQVTASGAMSIVNIALLREVINRGPENNDYYMLQIVLISVSFALQILAGFLSIVVASITNYYDASKQFLCSDLTENVCFCRLKRKSKTKKVCYGLEYPLGPEYDEAVRTGQPAPSTTATTAATATSETTTTPAPSTSTLSLASTSDKKPLVPAASSSKKKLPPIDAQLGEESGCPCYCTTRTMEDHEYELLDKISDWEAQQIALEERAAAAKIRVVEVSKELVDAKEDLAKLERKKDLYKEEEFRAKTAAIQERINKVLYEKSIMDDVIRGLKISKRQGEVLKERQGNLMTSTIFKMASFWQGFLNYIFYTVFILSAFITAFGLSAPAGADVTAGDVTNASSSALIRGGF